MKRILLVSAMVLALCSSVFAQDKSKNKIVVEIGPYFDVETLDSSAGLKLFAGYDYRLDINSVKKMDFYVEPFIQYLRASDTYYSVDLAWNQIGVGANFVAAYNYTKELDFLGFAGAHIGRNSWDTGYTDAFGKRHSASHSEFNLYLDLGLGVEYKINKQFTVGAKLDLFDLALTARLGYYF